MIIMPNGLALAHRCSSQARLTSGTSQESTLMEPPSAFLDALVALGDRERIEAEAPKWLQTGTFAEPFALRALGLARGDRALLKQALERFEAMKLSWHAEQTRHQARASSCTSVAMRSMTACTRARSTVTTARSGQSADGRRLTVGG
jgi:hypothetical protein